MMRKVGMLGLVAGLGVVGYSGVAAADGYYYDDNRASSRLGIAVEAGGGVSAFTRGELANVTSVGGTWDVRLILGTRWYVGGEVTYVGSANKISVDGISTSATLIGNGLQAALRLQIPIPVGRRGLIEPYILGGVGWMRYDLSTSSAFVNQLASGDNGLAVPLGGGLLFVQRPFLIDVRAVYALGYYNNPVLGNNSDSGTDTWAVTANLGFEF